MNTLADREMLEIVLFRTVAREHATRIANDVIVRFGSFAEAIASSPQRLTEVDGMTPSIISEFKFLRGVVECFTKGAAVKRLPLGSWSEVLDYCRVSMAYEDRESFRVLFLDKKNRLIADEVQGVGTVDHVPVYPREVIRRALELSASAIVLVHNHPSGDPTPSSTDVKVTLDIKAICKPLGLTLHDHIIIARDGHTSLRQMRLI